MSSVPLGRAAPWLQAWFLAVLSFAICIAGLEAYSRSQGLKPTVDDSKDLWHYWRARAAGRDSKTIVFLGTSRVTADISLDTVRACLPGYLIIQLGLAGPISPIGTLRDFAFDPGYRGIIVCELDTPLLDRSEWQEDRGYREYRPASLGSYFESIVGAFVKEKSVLLSEPLRLRSLLVAFLHDGGEHERAVASRTFRRDIAWDFSAVADTAAMSRSITDAYRFRYHEHIFSNWPALSKDVDEIERMVRCVHARGGRVVFLRAPSSGERWRLEEQFHSKQECWDRFVKRTSAICIHFRDDRDMRALCCPDDSHLDHRDSACFTAAFVNALRRQGMRF